MADTTYRVRTIYDTQGLDKTSRESDRAQWSLMGLGNALQRAQGLLGNLQFFAAQYGFMSLVDGIKAAGSQLFDLQVAAENAKISIAGLMSAGNAPGANDFNMALLMSEEVLKKMRVHARLLPGEFEELQTVFEQALLPGLQGGKSVNEVESMSARIMSVGKSLGMAAENAGHGFQMMLMGRAGTHNTFWMKMKNLIGVQQDTFNKMSIEDKWKAVDKALKGFDPMIKSYEKSWDAISSTSADHVKNLARFAGGGLFDQIKGAFAKFNEAIEANLPALEAIATTIGEKIGGALGTVIGQGVKFMELLGSGGGGVLAMILGPTRKSTAFESIFGAKGLLGSGGIGLRSGDGPEGGVGVFLDSLVRLASTIWDLVLPAFGSIWDHVKQLKPLWDQIWGFGGQVVDFFGFWLTGLFRVAEYIGGPLLDVLVWFGNVIAGVIEKIRVLFPSMVKEFEGGVEFKTQMAPDSAGNTAAEQIRAQGMQADWQAKQQAAFGKQGLGVWRDQSEEPMMAPINAEPTKKQLDQMIAQANLDKHGKVKKQPDVTVNGGLHIHQNIADSPTPEVVLVKTKQAIEQALIHPIESPTQRFSVIR